MWRSLLIESMGQMLDFLLRSVIWSIFAGFCSTGNFDLIRPQIDLLSTGFYGLNVTAPSLWQGEPVFVAGIEYLTSMYPQFKWTYQPVTDKWVKGCPDLRDNVQFLLARWYYTRRLSNVTSLPMIITFGCDDSVEMNALAVAWDILLLTAMNIPSNMDDRHLYPTFMTSAALTPALSVLYCDLFRTMKWTKLYLLFDRNSSVYYIGRDRMMQGLKDTCPRKLQITRSTFSRYDNDSTISSVLWEFNAKSRIMMYFGDSDGFWKMLMTASRLNMTRGEHAFLAVRPFESDMFGAPALWKPSKTDDEAIHQAYQAVMLVRLIDESKYKTPAMTKVIETWLDYDGPEKQLRNKLPNLVALHIGIELAGIAVNLTYTPEMIKTGRWPSGTVLADSLRNKTFDLDVGQTSMMAAGQISHVHFVSSYDLESRDYQVFLRSSVDPSTDTYRWNHVPGGQWFGGMTFPPDEPLCGFDGNANACQAFSKRDRPMIIALGSLVLLCLLVFVLVQARQAHVLHDIWWLIPTTEFELMKRRDSSFLAHHYHRPAPHLEKNLKPY